LNETGASVDKSIDDILREVETLDAGKESGSAPIATRPEARPFRRSRLVPAGIDSGSSIFFVLAAILVAIVGAIPFGSYALYPFALFVTMAHETGHALMSVATGGTVQSLTVSADLSGLTKTLGGIQALIAPAGYLGATALGAALLLTPLRFARWALAALALIPLADVALFHPDPFTAVWAIVFLAALGAAAWKLPGRWAAFLQMVIGLEAGLNAIRDLLTLLLLSGTSSHIYTDAVAESRALFFPAFVWAGLWAALSAAILLGTLALVLRRDLRSLRRSG
jgi:hypothetical protein